MLVFGAVIVKAKSAKRTDIFDLRFSIYPPYVRRIYDFLIDSRKSAIGNQLGGNIRIDIFTNACFNAQR
jgi:hypothetical protein